MKSRFTPSIFILILVAVASPVIAQDNTQVGLPDGAIARLGKGGINIMRFSPDGTRLAVGTDVGLWLYDVRDGKAIALFTDIPSQVNALAFSDDGEILASGGHGNPNIQLWNLLNNSKHSTLNYQSKFNYVKALSFYGSTLVSIDRSGSIRFWNINNSEILSEITGAKPHDAVVFSLTGNKYAINDSSGRIHVVDTSSNSQHIVLRDETAKGNTLAIAVSSNTKVLVSGGEDKVVRIWDSERKGIISNLQGHKKTITSVAISPDDKMIASGDANKEILLWEVDNPKKLRTLTGHKSTVSTLTFAPEGTPKYGMCLVSGSLDGTIRFWNPDTGEELGTFATGHTKWIRAIAFAEDGSTLVSANFKGTVNVWGLDNYNTISTFTNGECDFVAVQTFSSDATRYICQGNDGNSVTFSPFGFGYSILAESDIDIKKFRLWEIFTERELLGPWNEYEGHVLGLSPEYTILAFYDNSNLIGWSTTDTSEELFNIHTEDAGFIDRIIFSSDSKLIALHESSEKPKIFNIEMPNEPPLETNHDASSLAFSPDVKTLATTDKGSIYLYKLAKLPNTLPITFPIDLRVSGGSFKFSPDSKVLVGAGIINVISNVVIKLWDVETGEEITALSGHTEPIETLAFSHDGKILASGSFDGTILLWDWEKISRRQENAE